MDNRPLVCDSVGVANDILEEMVTTYILAGGNDRNTQGYGDRLRSEVIKYITNPVILSCFFSLPAEDWESKSHEWRAWFKQYFDEGFRYDYARKETFLDQVDAADVIYLHGGNTQLMLDTLPAVNSLLERFRGKIIIGSSAGANTLSRNFWSSARAVPAHGLGVVDMSIMVHYGVLNHDGRVRVPEDWIREEAEFQQYVGDATITHLPEGRFAVRQMED
jgi:hypothetical protein